MSSSKRQSHAKTRLVEELVFLKRDDVPNSCNLRVKTCSINREPSAASLIKPPALPMDRVWFSVHRSIPSMLSIPRSHRPHNAQHNHHLFCDPAIHRKHYRCYARRTYPRTGQIPQHMPREEVLVHHLSCARNHRTAAAFERKYRNLGPSSYQRYPRTTACTVEAVRIYNLSRVSQAFLTSEYRKLDFTLKRTLPMNDPNVPADRRLCR